MPWEVGIDLSDGDRSVLAVAALALGATTVVLLFLCCRRLCCCCGSRRSASGVGYESVPHQLDGEELDGDDEGKDFDILLETAMADVVVEHAAATATKARDALAAALAREGGEGGERSDLDRWARAARADPDFLSPRKLEGVLRFGALFRLANGLGAARERTGAE